MREKEDALDPRVRMDRTRISPWVDLVATEIKRPGQERQLFHSVGQADYVNVVVVTTMGSFALVRQFRPAVGLQTWELPGGLLDSGEEPASSAKRETLEETGLTVKALVDMGTLCPDTGRLSNRTHCFFCVAEGELRQAEQWVYPALFSPGELRHLVLSGEFHHQGHVGLLHLARIHPEVAKLCASEGLSIDLLF